ncbi:hypothetical protein [Methanosarcina siciliae]|uniref:hypothetical protein n=1 Tax=Methanosarcina siciliae TaxID=38027 RepID=UPI00064E1B72|nr:hypothetical protein [Methanosarcina siciliae]
MIAKSQKFVLSVLLASVLLVSMAFVPAVTAQPENELADGFIIDSNGQITPKSVVGELGENICDGLIAVLWTLDHVIDDDRIEDAQDDLSEAADAFRNNNISRGMDYLDYALSTIWDILYDWASQIPSWLYNELVDLLNEAQDFIDQYS